MRKSVSVPNGVMEVDWMLFGELCRALALRVAHEYQPEVVLGVAKAGVIPGVVVASIMQCDFASMVVTRTEADADPILVTGPPAWWFYPVAAIIVSWLVHVFATMNLSRMLGASSGPER